MSPDIYDISDCRLGRTWSTDADPSPRRNPSDFCPRSPGLNRAEELHMRRGVGDLPLRLRWINGTWHRPRPSIGSSVSMTRILPQHQTQMIVDTQHLCTSSTHCPIQPS
jgi:hypothetical protein